LTISVDNSKLTTPGTYNGSITVTPLAAGSSPATINVQVIVSPGTISTPTSTLTFNQVAGGPAPPAQTLPIGSTPVGLNFTVTTSTTPPGGTWLSVTPTSGTTPLNLAVSVNAGSLTPGTYSGTVTITSTGAAGSPISVPVVFTVSAPGSITVSPTSLTFNYTVGTQAPPAQQLTIGSSTPITINAAVSTASPWLQVAPAQSTVPGSLAVSVQPTTLSAGTYNGSIAITSPNLAGPVNVPVTLNVTAIPKPVITSIGNAGSYATGALSPGENIVIFGTGIGPTDLAVNTPAADSYGTTVGKTRVLFDGVPAPILYASATQTSVMVPYGVNGRATTAVVVEFSGVPSNAVPFNVVAAAPGIYTLNTAGTGPGAIVNQNGTVNTPNVAEKRGNIISVYMTGEGQTNPGGVDGSIIPPLLSALKRPLLPVTATIGGVQAEVQYAGSAAGLISGVMQVNVLIPATAPTGTAVPIVVSVGGTPSQAGVTVAVQ
jgi:uncharacterized protein (TIGR03437 family)